MNCSLKHWIKDLPLISDLGLNLMADLVLNVILVMLSLLSCQFQFPQISSCRSQN